MRKMLFTIISDISGFFTEYAVAGILAAMISAFGYLFGVLCYRKIFHKEERNQNLLLKRFILVFFLAWYWYIVLGITIFSRSESGTRFVSFELFRTFGNTFYARKQVYENVILFLPYSVLLYLLAKSLRNVCCMFLMGFLGSLFIETTQWATHTGYFEIDDILTNTFGMLLGFWFCTIISKIKKPKE